MIGNRDAHPEEVAADERLLDLFARVREHQHDLLHAPRGRGDRRDVQALVDLGARRVVDSRDDVLDVIVLQRDAGGHDVGVVAARDRDERVGLVHPGLLEDVAIESEADDRLGVEARREAIERLGALVDDGDVVAGVAELLRQEDPDAAAAHDDRLHRPASVANNRDPVVVEGHRRRRPDASRRRRRARARRLRRPKWPARPR